MAVVLPGRRGQGAAADAGDDEETGPGVPRGDLREDSPAGTRFHRSVPGSVSGRNRYPALRRDSQGAAADPGDDEETGPGVPRGDLREDSPAGTRFHRSVQGSVSGRNRYPTLRDDAL